MTGKLTNIAQLFQKSLKEVPSQAEAASHQLLLRAGYIRQNGPGVFTWLPLGLRTLRRIETVIREELETIDAQEVLLPSILPLAPFEATNRIEDFGSDIFTLEDRRGTPLMLGPTHEEMFTLLAKDMCNSYRDFPINLYQIQTKYRDEIRPRAGLLRGREFIMADSYSFGLSEGDLSRAYHAHREAYKRIFDRLGLDYAIVKATAGAMGGSESEEFLVRSSAGDDTFLTCSNCTYAANVEVNGLDENSLCPSCGVVNLKAERGMELGHIFKLGTKYSEALGLSVHDSLGVSRAIIMGSYGIGVSRAVAAIAETTLDENGLAWPREVAPYDVHLVVLASEAYDVVDELTAGLTHRGLNVLLDERFGRMGPGAKLRDAELLGVPHIVIVGRDYAKTEKLEYLDRLTGKKRLVSVDEVLKLR